MGIALTLHLLAATIWVGGMFFAFVCLRSAAAGLALLAAVFALALRGSVSGLVGWGVLLTVPFFGALLYIGFVGRNSPKEEHPNPIEMFARGGRT